MFIAVLFTIVIKWKKAKSSLTDKMWPVHTNEYSSALKRKDGLKSKHMTLEDIMLSEGN